MKKRLPAVILALALCLGLTVPAVATSTMQVKGLLETSQYNLTIRCPDDYMITHKTATYRVRLLRSISSDQGRFFVYNEETSSPVFDMTYVPLSADIVISGLSAVNERIALRAWSDPDGDGVYDMRLVDNNSFPYPLADSYTQPATSSFYPGSTLLDYGWAYISSGYNSDRTAVTITADSLYQLYGANTIFAVHITDPRSGESSPASPSPVRPVSRVAAESSGGIDEQFFVFLLTDEDTPNPAPAFTDTPSWCSAEAQWAVDQGITNGAGSATLFAPTLECTHDQILTFLWRAADKPDAAQAPITVASYYQDAVNWAYEKGFISDSFRASAPCTRAQAVWYIWKALEEPQAAKAASFSDVAPNSPDLPAVSWAVEKGVTNGYGSPDAFAPDKACSRGEIACFLYRAFR